MENEIQYLKRCIDQKDENIRELTSGVRNSEKAREVDLLKAKLEELQSRCDKQAELLSESEKNDRLVNKRLSTMLNERDAEIKQLHQKFSSMSSSAGFSRFNLTDAGTPLKRTRVSFEDISESFNDSDVSRHAAIAEISAVPHYMSMVSEMVSTYIFFGFSYIEEDSSVQRRGRGRNHYSQSLSLKFKYEEAAIIKLCLCIKVTMSFQNMRKYVFEVLVFITQFLIDTFSVS